MAVMTYLAAAKAASPLLKLGAGVVAVLLVLSTSAGAGCRYGRATGEARRVGLTAEVERVSLERDRLADTLVAEREHRAEERRAWREALTSWKKAAKAGTDAARAEAQKRASDGAEWQRRLDQARERPLEAGCCEAIVAAHESVYGGGP